MKDILVATHNQNKLKELKALLKKFNGINIFSLDEVKACFPVIVEDGKTFRQNAVKKAVITSKFFDGLVLADDSGLEVEALNGRPGVRSARFARTKATDNENNRKLLKLMEKVPKEDRKGKFVCHVALAQSGELLESFEGEIKGYIIDRPRGKKGFGYDPLFLPEGKDKSFAEMAAADKNRISHRAMALKLLKNSIDKYL
ncbi:MAG: RdgB/HAM1 family non-canonical purine NTP pyrophosphatase [Candidatus Omnitrophota bacterium]